MEASFTQFLEKAESIPCLQNKLQEEKDAYKPGRNSYAPCVQVDNKPQADSEALQNFCYNERVVIIRGLHTALDIKMEVFSPKTLMNQKGNAQVTDIRIQTRTSLAHTRSGSGVHINSHKEWRVYSKSADPVSLLSFAKEQAQSTYDYQTRMHAGKKGASRRAFSAACKHGIIEDIQEADWSKQLDELRKLPTFLRWSSPQHNMLQCTDVNIVGMQGAQIWLSMAGTKIPGHQEDNFFCAVHMNMGPASYEWHAVPEQYFKQLHQLRSRKGVPDQDAYWIVPDDTKRQQIPVYSFLQQPGDLVWIGPGTVYCIQALGVCNSVTWNVGPLTFRQYRMAFEQQVENVRRHKLNETVVAQCPVPMLNVTWSLVRNTDVHIHDYLLFLAVRYVCGDTLRTMRSMHTLYRQEHLKDHTDGMRNSFTNCTECQGEVHNTFFSRKLGKQFQQYCMDCAKEVGLQHFIFWYIDELENCEEMLQDFVRRHPEHHTSIDDELFSHEAEDSDDEDNSNEEENLAVENDSNDEDNLVQPYRDNLNLHAGGNFDPQFRDLNEGDNIHQQLGDNVNQQNELNEVDNLSLVLEDLNDLDNLNQQLGDDLNQQLGYLNELDDLNPHMGDNLDRQIGDYNEDFYN